MKINKKGFTLVEIIVCVAIIAVVAVVIGVNSEKIFGKDNSKEDVKTTIISAAKVFTDGDRGIVEPLYKENGQSYIIVTVGDLIEYGLLEEGLKDENGNTISNDIEVLVTRNSEGFLEYTYNPDDTSQGYLVATDIKIANGDTFACNYLINEEYGLKFSNDNGKYLDESGNPIYNMTLVNDERDVDTDGEYYCNPSTVSNGTEGTYNVTYTYQLHGVRKTAIRVVKVLEPMTIEEITSSKVTSSEGLFHIVKESSNKYTIYRNSTNATFTINDLGTSYGTNVRLVYGIGTNKQVSNNLELSLGTNTINVYPVKNKLIYLQMNRLYLQQL